MERRGWATRRHFLRMLGGGVATVVLPVGVGASSSAPARWPRERPRAHEPRTGSPRSPEPRAGFGGHPEPRPGVDGSGVLDPATVRSDLTEVFEGIRSIPHIADGIGCHCGCGAMPEMRSLLSCYEGIGMAQFCVICEGEGRMAVELHADGRTLDEIRTAIDRRFG